jgi:hypothetical protein
VASVWSARELVAAAVRAGLDGHLDTLRRKEMVEPR